MFDMAAVAGRSRRVAPPGAPTVLLQGRVAEPTRDAAREAADDLGISIAAYLEKLVLADAELHVVRPAGPFVQEELPVSA